MPRVAAVAGVRLHVPSSKRAAGVPEVIHAPVVVSNADLCTTVMRLVPPGALPDDVVDAVRHYEMTLPLFVVYLILDRDLAEELPNTNLWLLGDDVEEEYAGLFAGRAVRAADDLHHLGEPQGPHQPEAVPPGTDQRADHDAGSGGPRVVGPAPRRSGRR